MAISRYRNTEVIDNSFYGSVDLPSQKQIDNIDTFRIRVSKFDRLDQLAFKHLGSGEYWWIIALVNDIEWGFAFEEGTVLRIPVDVNDILSLF